MKVKFADLRQVTHNRSFSTVVASHDLLRRASIELVRALLPIAKRVRLLGVTVSNFEQVPVNAADELPLFGAGELIGIRLEAAPSVAAGGCALMVRHTMPH